MREPSGGALGNALGERLGSAPRAGDAAALESALEAAGLRARVRAEGRLALRCAPPETFAPAPARDAVTRLARAHGFTHVALVLEDEAP